jgi:glucose/arabinose dehydrogenase
MKRLGFGLLLLSVMTGPAFADDQSPPGAADLDAPHLFSANCAGCHGEGLGGGRGPSLFVERLLSTRTDDALRHTITEGIEAGGMPSFNDVLNAAQISQIVAYLRNRSGELKNIPEYIPDPDNQIIRGQKQAVKIEVVASGLDTPWGEAFLPDGRMLVTERGGHIRIIDHGKLLQQPVTGTPVPWVRQDGGFFDVAIHPDYKRNGWIYLSYSEILPGYSGPIPDATSTAPSPPTMTRIVRGRINGRNEWVDQQDIWKADPSFYTSSNIHYGSRFLFDGKGHLFFTIGERGDMSNAQKLSTPLGKIHRINDDGAVPPDNPFAGRPGAVPTIWSYGHRNSEGLSFDPMTGLLWESEHGPTGGDEINIIEKGHNYGWGVVTMGLQPGITHQHEPGMDDPITYYSPAIAPSGIGFYRGNRYPGWKNDLFAAALVGQKLIRYEIQDRKIAAQETIFQQFGRTRAVITGPDGLLYVLVMNPTGRDTGVEMSAAVSGMVIKLVPVH